MPRAKALYITTAGMAATSPIAVASRASAMPGATTARLVVLVFDMPIKLSMIPHTVPNKPTKGAVAPIVARTPIPRAIGVTSVLHTWGSALTHHPHVHMIVPGGGISLDGQRW